MVSLFWKPHKYWLKIAPKVFMRWLLDERFAGDKPVVNGYTYTMTISSSAGNGIPRYAVNADPHQAEGELKTNKRYFYIDSQAKQVHAHTGRPANSQDPLAN